MKRNRLAHRTDCEGFHRRDFLKAGALGLFGLGMADLLRLKAFASRADGKEGAAKSVILIWMGGGPSHLDLWDLKPDAPQEVRGFLNPISTNVPGIQICEHLPRIAKQMDKICVIRSMTSIEADHARGTHYLMTGFQPLPGFAVPSYGSVVAKLKESRSALPPYIAIPTAFEYSGAGFLGAALDPFSVGGAPSRDDFQVHDLHPPNGMQMERLDRRRTLRQTVDAAFKKHENGSERVRSVDEFYNAAYDLISSSEAREAFDLRQEPDTVRDSYLRDDFGQSCLLARRLVEAGVGFVTVSNGGWDMHSNIYPALAGKLGGFDQTVSALIGDLSDRGLLDSTLVIAMGEFGRTPVINRDAGRDHHPKVFSMMMAGGGIKGGTVVGSSDPRGTEPAETPVRPEDLSATIYHCLGIDYNQSLVSPEGVRVVLSRGGRPVRDALA